MVVAQPDIPLWAVGWPAAHAIRSRLLRFSCKTAGTGYLTGTGAPRPGKLGGAGSSAGPERAEVRVDPRGERRGCGQPRRRWRGLDRFAGGQGGGIEEPGELPVTVPVVAGEPGVVQPHRRVHGELGARAR